MLADLVDLVLPVRCAGCGVGGSLLCPLCLPGPGELRTRQLTAVTVTAACAYDGAVRQAVIGWKERGRRGLVRPLSTLLARAVDEALAGALGGASVGVPGGASGWAAVSASVSASADLRPVLVPVPTSAGARRARGGDLLARLCRRAGTAVGVRTVSGGLVLERQVRDSVGLNRRDRIVNLRGAFHARPAPPGVVAVVVDDVVTTGATISEAVSALQAAGWPVVGAAVVASTALR